ncbi:MAG TPA: sulfotransferase [Gaiellaceae bacterium]|nr:sulfotransferase [Gaiellaceae bacterium]
MAGRPTHSSSGRPILVTGAHRSGTTWVGKMLALAPGVGYVHEPFSPRTPKGLSPAGFERYYTVVTNQNESRYRAGLERSLRLKYDLGAQLQSARGWRDLARIPRDYRRLRDWRRNGRRPLMKDPIALLSAEWLAEAFGMDVVVMIRHPAAFGASLKRLGWRHSFATFFDEDGTLPGVVRPYEAEIREQAQRPGDGLAQAALLWRLLYDAVDGYRERHPDWVFLRHEDASLDPTGTFERLYDRLALELTPAARTEIEQSSAADNPSELPTPHAVALDSAASLGRWRDQLTPAEAETLRERTRDVWPRFYAESDW